MVIGADEMPCHNYNSKVISLASGQKVPLNRKSCDCVTLNYQLASFIDRNYLPAGFLALFHLLLTNPLNPFWKLYV